MSEIKDKSRQEEPRYSKLTGNGARGRSSSPEEGELEVPKAHLANTGKDLNSPQISLINSRKRSDIESRVDNNKLISINSANIRLKIKKTDRH